MGLEIERVVECESDSLPLLSLNHVSFVCESVSESVRFYEEVLGFVMIKRPSSFKFEGAWLFNYGIGIHLLECNSPADAPKKKGVINPKDNHISFQCSDMQLVMRKLEAMNIDYVTAVVEEGGVKVDQLFFHDPDGYMVEICNCDNLPVLPLSACTFKKLAYPKDLPSIYAKELSKVRCAAQVETLLMESLLTDMINISF
ncbi:metallothiol transferase FosB-like protein [Cinnamomum micranthum f. kanehirae]|uniref:Metallothiol transferase FosB-like protein n=1 Tax=Cinnamomum micranthum f. kanehirae TaxID=337451 RepID=A0A443Q2G3_9MAGN|nr:metallothiol transferase FosB-like protein [Cinnamomum micranthum f. kanehirae]